MSSVCLATLRRLLTSSDTLRIGNSKAARNDLNKSLIFAQRAGAFLALTCLITPLATRRCTHPCLLLLSATVLLYLISQSALASETPLSSPLTLLMSSPSLLSVIKLLVTIEFLAQPLTSGGASRPPPPLPRQHGIPLQASADPRVRPLSGVQLVLRATLTAPTAGPPGDLER